LGEDCSVFSGDIGGAPVRLWIGGEAVGTAERIEVEGGCWVVRRVETRLGNALIHGMGGGAPLLMPGDTTIIIEIVAISTKTATQKVLNKNTRLDTMSLECHSDSPVGLPRCRPTPQGEMIGWKIPRVA